MNNIYLIGFMGSGKTAVARSLAEITGRTKYDTDDLIVEKEESEITEIFATKGEPYFRKVENEIVKSLADKQDLIVSCGGGVIKSEENVQQLKQGGKVVLLSATPETVLERVLRNDRRPLLEGKKNLSDIKAMMEERRPFYEKAYDIKIQVDEKSPEDIAKEILKEMDGK